MDNVDLAQKRIAVLMGGKSGERQVSLRSGAGVMAALKRLGFEPISIDPIDEDWLRQMETARVDIAFLALHGKGCEDGTIQGALEAFEFAYTGSGVLASALAMNKVMTKRVLFSADIPTPPYVAVEAGVDLAEQCAQAVEQLGFPVVLKPSAEGSSIGVSIVRELPELERLARKAQHDFGEIFFEQYIKGQEITVGVLGVGNSLRALPVLELVPKKEFYDYEAKYTHGMTEFILPARLSDALTQQAQDLAVRTHKTLGCWGVSRVDMRVDTAGQPYVLEVNTLPGLTDLSDLPAQAAKAGITYDMLVLEILDSASVRL